MHVRVSSYIGEAYLFSFSFCCLAGSPEAGQLWGFLGETILNVLNSSACGPRSLTTSVFFYDYLRVYV